MKKIFLLLTCLVTFCFLRAQIEKFDIARFIAPAGWQRVDSNGVVAFLDSRINNGLTSFCQIFLYPSHASSGNASGDFTSEWDARVVKPTGTN